VDVVVYGSRPAGGEPPAPASVALAAKPYTRVELRLGDFLAADYVSATVGVDGGGVLVEHRVNGPQGSDRAPCSSVSSPTWTVPVGATDTTAANALAREVLVFFNPFPADAVLDPRFSTEAGERGTPEDLIGLVVPGRSVVAVDLAAADLTVSTEVAAQITARAGRVVVDRIQTYADPETGRAGVALSPGVPASAAAWVFPVGELGPNRRELLVVANQGELPADVDVEVRPLVDDMAPEPFELTVQPNRHVALDLWSEIAQRQAMSAPPTSEPQPPTIAQPVPYTLVVRTADGTQVSAERLTWGVPGQPGGGVSVSNGSAVAGTRLVADLTGAEAGSRLVLFNPSTESVARVQLSIIGDGQRREPAAVTTVDVEPGSSRAVPVEQLGSGQLVVIMESSSPVVAERDMVEGTERSIATAVPDADTVSMLDLLVFADLGG
ncbi:MAG TPA: DUF5719 family protein, partial [Acidimicrobiales bacterium]